MHTLMKYAGFSRMEKPALDGCIQQAHAGIENIAGYKLYRTAMKVDGPSEEVLEQWHQHFNGLLNQQSVFNEEVIQQMPVVPPRLEFDGVVVGCYS